MYLLDTDIVIYALKGHRGVVENLKNRLHSEIAISAVTLMELYYGAYKSQNIESNLAKVNRLETVLEILPADRGIVETFGRLKSNLEKKGRPLDDFDLILAATALSHNMVLVSNNQRHYRRIAGLKTENWAGPDAT